MVILAIIALAARKHEYKAKELEWKHANYPTLLMLSPRRKF